MKLKGVPTLTGYHDISHFNLMSRFYFDDVLCYSNYINAAENKVNIRACNPLEKRFVPCELVTVNLKSK